jgi:hypothetical protein
VVICKRPAAIAPPGTTAMEGHFMKRRWNAALQSLVLIRLGQELGTSSETAQAVAHAIDWVLGTLSRLLG